MKTVKVKKVTRLGNPCQRVYDIGVAKNHNFFIRPKGSTNSVLVSNCHQLTPQAEQALLKPLEDPPSHVLWILGTTNPEKLAAAIKGRCHHLPVKPLGHQSIIRRLQQIAKRERVTGLEEPHFKAMANLSGGQMRDAIGILENTSSFIAGLGTDVEPEALSKIIEDQAIQTVDSVLDNIASAILVGLYTNSTRIVCREIAKTTEFVPLMQKLMDLNQYMVDRATLHFDSRGQHPAVFASVSRKNLHRAMLKREFDIKRNLGLLLRVHNLILDARAEMMTFVTPERSMLVARLGRMSGIHRQRSRSK